MNQRYKNMLNDAARRFDAASNTTAAAQYDDTDTGRCAECDGALDTTFGNICEDCTAPASHSGRGDSGRRMSERPWTVGTGAQTARNHAVCSGPRIVATVIGTGYRDSSTHGWSPDSEADAAYIVKAVNSFEAMRDALKDAEKFMRVARNYFPKSIRNGDKFNLENTNAAITKALLLTDPRQ